MKRIHLFSVLLLCCVFLAACGQGKESGPSAPQDSVKEVSEPSGSSGDTSEASGSADSSDSAEPSDTPEPPVPDTEESVPDMLSRLIKETHPSAFTKMDENAFDLRIKELKEQWEELSRKEDAAYYALRELVAGLGDEHTMLGPSPDESQPELPFYMMIYDGRWIIVQAQKSCGELAGKELKAVNGVPIAEICERLRPLIGCDTQEWADVQSSLECRYLRNLNYIGVTDQLDSVSITVEDCITGGESTCEVKALTDGYDYENSKLIPLAQTLAQSGYYYANLLEDGTLFIQYNICSDNPNLPMDEFAKTLEEQVLENPPAKAVLDLRHNGGGDSQVIVPLLDTLKKLQENGTTLYCLIGASTFSSAVMNAVDVKELGAVLIGGPTGGSLKFGEVQQFTLPGGFVLYCSSKDFSGGYEDPGQVNPDIRMEQTVEDLLNGTDSVIEYIKNE